MVTRSPWRSAGIALAAGVLTSTLWVAPAIAEPDYPSQDDIANAHQAEESTAAQISAIEVQLASNTAESEQASIDAEIAAEAFHQADADRDEAQDNADAAAAAADQADADVLAAQQHVADIAMASYRNNGEVQQLSMFFSADDFEQALDRATMFQVIGNGADDAYQSLDAAERVAEVMHRRSEESLAAADEAAVALQDASRRADAAALAAQTAVETSAGQRDGLISELASLRQSTVALEEQRQDGIDAERRARENAAAEAALEAQAAEEAAAEAAATEEASDRSENAAARSNNRTAQASSNDADRTNRSAQESSGSSEDETEAPRPGSSSSGSGGGGSSESSGGSSSGSSGGPSSGSSGGSSGGSGSGSSGGSSGSTAPSSVGRAALNWAMTQVGKPYVWGAEGPNSYDCSGLTMRAFQHAGVSLPRTTGAQYAATRHVPISQMRPGDLIFYSSNGSASGIYHVAIYAGNGMRVHAPSPGKNVEYTQIWWTNVLPYAGRV